MRKQKLPLIVLSCFGVLIALGALFSAVADTWKIITPAAISAQSKIIIDDNITDQGLTTSDVSPGMVKFLKSMTNGLSLALLEELAGIEAVAEQNGQYSYVYHPNKGVLPTVELAFNTVTTIPVSGVAHVASGLQNMGLEIAPPAQAQGYGYMSLLGLQDAWRIFRNVAYVFFTIIIVAVGFMILFQQKLDGNLVISVQQALPRIVLSLILVTFSYAIVGFLIDIMYLAMFLFGGLFNWRDEGVNSGMYNLMGDSIWGVGWKMIGNAMGGVFSLYGHIVGAGFQSSADMFDSFLGGVGGILKMIFVDIILTTILGGLITIILVIVIFFAMISAVWKLFKTLLKSYVLIMFDVIFGPLQLMLGALPSGDFIKKWFNSLIGNIAAFVGVFVLMTGMYLFRAMKDGSNELGYVPRDGAITGQVSAQSDAIFAPPFTAGSWDHNGADIAMILAQLGLLLAMPEIIEKIKEKFGAKSGFLGEIVKAATDRVKESAKGTGGQVTAGLGAAGAAAITRAAGGTLTDIPFFENMGVTRNDAAGIAEAFSGGKALQKEGKTMENVKTIGGIMSRSKWLGKQPTTAPLYTQEKLAWRRQEVSTQAKLRRLSAALSSVGGDPVAEGQIKSQMGPLQAWIGDYSSSNADGFENWMKAGKPSA